MSVLFRFFLLHLKIIRLFSHPSIQRRKHTNNFSHIESLEDRTLLSASPVFDFSTYDSSVAEDASVGAMVASVNATDPDGDPLTYSIHSGNTGGEFSIDSNGNISLNSQLDYETQSSFQLGVEVSDGALTDSATVTINVDDVNETPTIDPAGPFSVAEDAAIGTSVGTVTASDPDNGDTLTYSISAGPFAIDNSGVITMTEQLDFETTSSYDVTVTVTDSGGLQDSTNVTINVDDVNEAPTIDPAGPFNVAEDATIGTSVGTIIASDPDNGETLSYSITGGTGPFAIDNSGNISTTDELDYETTTSYELTITVSDSGGLQDSTNVTINVDDVNETPTIDPVGPFNVSEDAATGTTVGTVSATDPDNGNTLSFSISGGPFAINNSGEISTTGPLDYETTPSYDVTITATDSGGLQDSITVTITIDDVVENSAPTISDQSFHVSEDASTGTVVGTVTASDPDSDPLTYSITGGSGPFSIDANSGDISTTGGLDYETTTSYTLTVEVSDGTETASATITVNVDDVVENSAPTISDQSFHVSEDASTGTVVGTVTASDPDSDPLTYSITGGSGPFSIDANSGDISTTGGLDYETTTSYTLTVEVSDGTESASASITVNVDDVVENSAPTISDQSFHVSEDASTGTVVGTVTASDPDSDPLTYSITGGSGPFSIDANSGDISTTGGLDYETTTSYTLTVEVSDGTETASATITVNVDDVVENSAPTIGDQSFHVSEDASTGTVVGTVTASDPDTGDTLTYSITNNGGGLFSIDANSGDISTTGGLDYETTTSYTLTVEVSDGTETASATITVNVDDVVENSAPTIGDQSFHVSEDASTGTVVGTVTASDPDTGDTLTYSITNNGGGLFSIDANSGDISTTGGLDYETTTSYTLTVEVSDGTETASATITVNVDDVNEAPTIDPAGSFNISEDADIGTVVGNVTSSDPDNNDTFSYSISGGPFSIDSSGVITTTEQLDYETTPSYDVTVIVTDSGGLQDSINFSISIDDVNEAPTIDPAGPFTIAEDAATGTVVGTVTASDPDTGNTLSYSITSGSGPFSIDANSGEISTTDELDYETTSEYTLTVEVSDGIETASTQITINVTNVNEAPTILSFSAEQYLGTTWRFFGSVSDDGDLSSLTIEFGEYLEDQTTQVNADGTFEYFAFVPGNQNDDVSAQTTDSGGMVSNIYETTILQA